MNSALLYIRVSSKEQEKEGFSLDAQEKLGKEYALRNNLTIIKHWRVSESAWKDERTAFNQMIEYAKGHDKIKHIIFDVADRMTRNDMDKIRIYTLIKLHDKKIHFSRSNKTIDKHSGSEDEFMLDIEVAVAKKMSNDISRKTKMGMLEKAEQGLYPSYAPIGYKNNSLTHLIEVDEDIAHYIKKAFSFTATGSYSLSMIANLLYREGFRGRKGNRIGKGAIHYLLKNPLYYGAFFWKSKLYQGSHAPLVSKSEFENVQNILGRDKHPSTSKRNFAFNNLMTCGICNCKVIGERKKNKYNYYHCTFSKGRHSGDGYIREEVLAKKFEEPIQQITINEDLAVWLKEALKESNKNTIELQEKRLSMLRNQCERAENRLNRLYDARFDEEVDKETFETKKGEYEAQLVEIKSQIDGSRITNPNFYEDGCKILELSSRLHSLYVKASYEEKAKLLNLVASNYTLIDLTPYPTYRKPFSFLTKRASRSNWLPG